MSQGKGEEGKRSFHRVREKKNYRELEDGRNLFLSMGGKKLYGDKGKGVG